MQAQDLQIIGTKLRPPSPPRWTLHRERVTTRLLEAADYRLTILQAGAGYGKSTALTALDGRSLPLAWYHLEEDGTDPQRFLLYLLHAVDRAMPGSCHNGLALLEQWDLAEHPFQWQPVINAFLNELSAKSDEILLVLDDAHILNQAGEANQIIHYIVTHATPALHLVAATRYPVNWDELIAMRVRGQVLEISQEELAFTPDEVADLFRDRYQFPLTADQCRLLAGKSDGWPMILPLVWQRLRLGSARSILQALEQLSGSAGDLFTYLAQEIWNIQKPEVRDFLRDTSILRELTTDLCDCVRQSGDSASMLDYLSENGFFVFTVAGGSMRYHHLFRDLLCRQLIPQQAAALHRRAAACYAVQSQGTESAIEHYLAAGSYSPAAKLLSEHGRLLIANGRLNTLQTWIDSLPPAILTQYPPLLIYLGDIARLHSRFQEALAWYQEAEQQCRASRDLSSLGQALRGQARVYLDTVNPSRAEALLAEAVRISDGQEDRDSQARLLDLLAENRLNQGRTAEAEALRARSIALHQQDRDEAAIPYRLLLRTGRLAEARRLLQESAAAENKNPVLKPRAHRETLLLLSLVFSFLGEREPALAAAEAGTKRGQELDSPFITAVGWMRQGHAWLLLKESHGYEQAEHAFQQAIRISDQLQASRLKVEAYWGLCQVYGARGLLSSAHETAEMAITLAGQAGDAWVAACIRVTLGAAYLLAAQHEPAAAWLNHAYATFRECNDTHGQAVARLWQCLLWKAEDDDSRLPRGLNQLMHLVQEHEYEFLFTRRTLLGPPDTRALLPLLLHATQATDSAPFAAHLLRRLGFDRLEFHPGFQLRVHTLGNFRMWHGRQEIAARAWHRKKARQLFLLLLTFHNTQIHRQQIVETLWPDLNPETGARDFKIAYNTLIRVLEPRRNRNVPSSFIERDGSRYGIRQTADLYFDVAEFDRLIISADRQLSHDPGHARDLYRRALSLYKGDYLQEFPYEEWANQERTRLLNRYLRTAERLAGSLLREDHWAEAIDVCHALLDHDNCWEPAYQIMINAYLKSGNRTQAIRTYQRCEQTLRSELDLPPSSATQKLIL
jgi:ATP/maltotriose-dependent transcriptional regulator MalT/DNA-binding SARP family transcriptional activator